MHAGLNRGEVVSVLLRLAVQFNLIIHLLVLAGLVIVLLEELRRLALRPRTDQGVVVELVQLLDLLLELVHVDLSVLSRRLGLELV